MNQIHKDKGGWLARIRGKIPEQAVGLVPADAFFLRLINLPEGLPEAEQDAFVQLDMEGNSPFPIEQLAWGYLTHVDSPHAFAYATPYARLKAFEISNPESYYQLFPGFISLFGEQVEQPTIRFLCQRNTLSAIFLNPGQSVPVKITSHKLADEVVTDSVLLQARSQLLESLGTDGYACEEGLWLGQGIEVTSDGAVQFVHRHVHADQSIGLKTHILQLTGKALWHADLRGVAYASKESQIRQKSGFIWKALKFAAVAAVLLLLIQVATIGLKGFNHLVDTKIEKLEPHAIRVENKMTLADKLNQSTEEDIKPFNLLEAINPVRPDSIFFEKIRCRRFNELEIEGKSTQGVTPVNAFADSIKQLPFVSSIENNSRTVRNQTSFEFVIQFAEIPQPPDGGFIIPEEPETPEAEAETEIPAEGGAE